VVRGRRRHLPGGDRGLEVVIDEWLETAREKGWKIPEPKGRRLLYA